MKGVFDTRPETEYDDDIRTRYHLPQQYLAEAERVRNDWIVHREPRRGDGRMAYIAVARVVGIEPDRTMPGCHYARLSDYLEFDRLVPLHIDKNYFEERLNKSPNIGSALRGRSVRTISDGEFARIALAGFDRTLHEDLARNAEHGESDADREFRAFVEAGPEEKQRRVAEMLTNRPLRDRAFRRAVVSAYKETCAVTGLRIINGGGRAEVQAVHIRPVMHDGPDVVQNGMALSATCHWLLDRHLISFRDDFSLIVAHNRVPPEFQSLFLKQTERIHLPDDEREWPSSTFLEWHRERFLSPKFQMGSSVSL